MCFHRLVQRLCEIEAHRTSPADYHEDPAQQATAVDTVKAYAIIDTGLQCVAAHVAASVPASLPPPTTRFKRANPATGWQNERCALLLRQRHSRLFPAYDAFSFAGIVPMQCQNLEPMRQVSPHDRPALFARVT
jgi:hypothetical protein